MDKGHGRIEIRRIRVSDILAGYIDFPYGHQVFQIERIRRMKGKETQEVAYGITSLTTDRAEPGQVLQLTRGHWGIENSLHWVRDVTFDEDRSQVRRGAAAQAMAALRNMAIGLLRLAGAKTIAAALRECQQVAEKAFRLIGIKVAG